MRPLPIFFFAAVIGLGACAHPPSAEVRYLRDGSFRRSELEASLVSHTNGYSQRRLSRYGSSDGWDALPALNPTTAPFTFGDVQASDVLAISADASRGDRAALRALGEKAFFRYPAQIAPYLVFATTSRERVDEYGFWVDGDRVGGLVRVVLPDGGTAVGFTCSTCHAGRTKDGRFIVGMGNAHLDLGKLITDAARADGRPASSVIANWGPGRIDVSTSAGTDAVRIPDLRPVRGLTHLQHDATVEQRNIASLALRIETLLITGHGESLRPPREIALGLAEYVWSLADALPSIEPRTPETRRGRAVFDAQCAGCHAPPFLTGTPVRIEAVGTDPRTGRSAERGTGMYRVPALRGVGDREGLLHDGAVRDVDALLDPTRTRSGHDYGQGLVANQRADLLAYLRSL